MLLHLKAQRESDVTFRSASSEFCSTNPQAGFVYESGEWALQMRLYFIWGSKVFAASTWPCFFTHKLHNQTTETWRDIPRVDYVQSLLHWLIENDNIFCPFSIYVAGFALLLALSDFVQRHLTALTAWQCFCTINTWANHRSKTLPAPTNSIWPSCKLCEKITMWKHSVWIVYQLYN